MPADERLLRTAEEVSGWTELRQEQLQGMRHLLDGPTVVVSPLIALQRDQVASLRATGAPAAAAINSAQSAEDDEAARQAFAEGKIEYLVLSPERLANAGTLRRLHQVRPSLFVVDEAHCVSAWVTTSGPTTCGCGT